MTQRLIDLKADFVFKQIFAREGNEAILISFLNSILQLPPDQQITSVTLQNTELPRAHFDHKAALLDLLVKTDKNVYINVEIQFSNQKEIVLRMLWYWSYLFSKQLERGDTYKKVDKTITIALLNFSHFQDTEDFHTCFQLFSVKRKHHKLTDLMEMHFVEIPKVLAKWQSGEIATGENPLVNWLLLFVAHEHTELFKELEAIFMQDQEMIKLFEQWADLSQDPKFSIQYGLWLKRLSDEATLREESIEMGIERGIEQGIETGMIMVAKRLLKARMDKSLISETTDLSIEELNQLETELRAE